MSTRHTALKAIGIFLLSGIFASSAFAHVGPDRQTMIQKATKLQMPFIENQGQVKDQAVRFYANTFAGMVFVTEKGAIVYNLQKTDFFVSRFGPSGNLIYSTYIGGSADDYDSNGYGNLYVFDMAIDSAGNVYMTGETFSSDFPTTNGAYDRTINGGSDAFVLKLNAAGNLMEVPMFTS